MQSYTNHNKIEFFRLHLNPYIRYPKNLIYCSALPEKRYAGNTKAKAKIMKVIIKKAATHVLSTVVLNIMLAVILRAPSLELQFDSCHMFGRLIDDCSDAKFVLLNIMYIFKLS